MKDHPWGTIVSGVDAGNMGNSYSFHNIHEILLVHKRNKDRGMGNKTCNFMKDQATVARAWLRLIKFISVATRQ